MSNYPEGFNLLQIYKSGFNHRWSNNYLLPGQSFSAQENLIDYIKQAEISLHSNGVRFTYMRLSTTTRSDRKFRIIPIQVNGAFNQTSDILPFEVCAGYLLQTDDSYPGRKYYHGVIQENEQAAGQLNDAALTRMQAFATLLFDTTDGLLKVGKYGNQVTAIIAERETRNHQASRKRRYPR